MLDPAVILKRNRELKALRAPVEGAYRDIARLMRPEQADMFDGNSRTNVYDDINDSTALQALEAFAGGIFGSLTNPAARWFELTLPDPDLAKFGPVKRWLWDTANVIYASLSPPVSAFYHEVPAWFSDLGAFGLGTLYQEEDVGRQRIITRVIPLGETLIDLDANGEIDTFHRNFKLKGAKAKARYPELAGYGSACHDEAEYEFVHAVQTNPDYRPGMLGPAGMPFLSITVCEGLRNFRRIGGYREMPFATVMWNRRPGRVYPVGPGHAALPDVSQLNEIERVRLVAAQYAAEPPMLLADEGTVTPADFFPGAVLYGQVNDRGVPLAQPLARGQNFQLADSISAQRREAIQNAFYFNTMSLMRRPQMTATEFLGFQEEMLKQMGPNLARIQGQGLSPFLSRRYMLLERAGQIPAPPPELDGMPLDIAYVSPLAKLQKASNAQSVLRWVNGVGQLAQTTQDVGLLDIINGDDASAVLHDAFGPPPSVMRDASEIEAIRKNRAQLAAQRERLAQDAQQTETAAVAAHAIQAKTLSDQRGQA